jgi:hypothetical protein
MQAVLSKFGKNIVSYKQLISVKEVFSELNKKEKGASIEKHLKLFTSKWKEDYE